MIAKADARKLAAKLVAGSLTSTKLTKAEVKKDNGVMPMGGAAKARHPWGLSLSLDSTTLKKLGIDKLPAVGTEMKIAATAKVDRAEESESEDSGKRRSVSLQITHMAVAHSTKTARKKA